MKKPPPRPPLAGASTPADNELPFLSQMVMEQEKLQSPHSFIIFAGSDPMNILYGRYEQGT